MSFANPWILLALAIIPLLWAYSWWYARKRASSLRVSTVSTWLKLTPRWTQHIRRFLLALRFVALGLLVLALARPQQGYTEEDILTEGVDILITLEPERSLLDLVALKQDLEDLLGCQVDVVTEAAVSPYIRPRVLRDAVVL